MRVNNGKYHFKQNNQNEKENKTMKNLQVTWKGISPLIMHNCQCVNPLHPITKEMKKYTSF